MAKLSDKFKHWLAQKTEGCKSVSPLFSNALERPLSITERLRVRLHLFRCGACLNYFSNLKFMRETFKQQGERLDDDDAGNALSDKAKERIREALRASRNQILLIAVMIWTF